METWPADYEQASSPEVKGDLMLHSVYERAQKAQEFNIQVLIIYIKEPKLCPKTCNTD